MRLQGESLYVSRIIWQADRAKIDPYMIHQLLWQGFCLPRGAKRPFLFRADVMGGDVWTGALAKVLVYSRERPDWEIDGMVEYQCDLWEPKLRRGEEYRYFVRANPTQSRKGDVQFGHLTSEQFRAIRGKREPIRDNGERKQWLHGKGEQFGFELLTVRLSGSASANWQRGKRKGVYDGVDFDGVLRVIEPQRVFAALIEGIGGGKAFGFGLLSLGLAPRERMGSV